MPGPQRIQVVTCTRGIRMSFNEQDICSYIKKHQLSLDTADYIRRSALSLARDVGQAPGRPSMLIEHCSEKMGCTVNSESYLEHSYALELEFDHDVIAFYEQPATVECLRGQGNNPRPFPYTPDFLVLRNEGPQVIQIKHKKDLVRLSEQRSYWQKTETGYVDQSPAATFEAIGLQHRVVSSQDLGKLRTQNSRLIAQASAADVSAEAIRWIRTAPKNRKVCLMSQLLMDAKTDDVTAIVQLIHKKELYVRLDQHSLCVERSVIKGHLKTLTLIVHYLAIDSSNFPREGLNRRDSSLCWSTAPVSQRVRRCL